MITADLKKKCLQVINSKPVLFTCTSHVQTDRDLCAFVKTGLHMIDYPEPSKHSIAPETGMYGYDILG